MEKNEIRERLDVIKKSALVFPLSGSVYIDKFKCVSLNIGIKIIPLL